MVRKYPYRFDGLQPLEVYIRLVQILDDPDKLIVTSDLFTLRDIRPKVIKRRLLSVVTSDQTGFLAGGTSAFDSLRQIRKEQQLKKTEAVTALVKAKPYYCPAPKGRRAPHLSRPLVDPGVCLCTYGRRNVGSSESRSRRPARAA